MSLLPHQPYVRVKENRLIISREARREMLEGDPLKVLIEVYREGCYQGRTEANANWVREANRIGGAVQWTRLRRKPRKKKR